MLPPLHILSTQTLTAAAASVTFTLGTLVTDWDTAESITSRHLVLLVNAASDAATTLKDGRVQFNGDTGSNYNSQYIRGLGAAASAVVATGVAHIGGLQIPGTTYANAFGGGIMVVPHAFGASNHKATLMLAGG